jgi:hypothetical protein
MSIQLAYGTLSKSHEHCTEYGQDITYCCVTYSVPVTAPIFTKLVFAWRHYVGISYTELRPYRSSSIDRAVESHLCLQIKRECDRADSQETHAGPRLVKNCCTEFRSLWYRVRRIDDITTEVIFFFNTS